MTVETQSHMAGLYLERTARIIPRKTRENYYSEFEKILDKLGKPNR